ncbi:pyruvate kinase [Rhizomicrobium electricum]|nr:pyruvate kinase [Rhizomicrobium electricum]
MRRRRKTKILATIGPASSTPEMIRALFEAGADVFRINMSHNSHAELADKVRVIRELEENVGRPIAILADLQGPKIRLGTLPNGERDLAKGEKVHLVRKPSVESGDDIPIPHAEIFAAIQPGEVILIDDGKVRLKIEDVGKDEADAIVENGGVIKNKKGINLPDTVLPIPAMTPKDRSDLDAALALGVDWIALSFVQRPDDMADLKKIVGNKAGCLAKIEKPRAIDWLPEILDLSDAIMVARGDLGVELPVQEVPGKQKLITKMARKAGKPVVVATQMLESMITAPVPTRAEVTDVANAVFDGADAVMLSAESAAGDYPVEAVSMMDKIAMTVEGDPQYIPIMNSQRNEPESTTPDAIMAAVHEVTSTIHARAVVCWTKSGSTALRAARERSDAPIIALTPQLEVSRRLSLVWGLHCIYTEDAQDLDDMVDRAARFAFLEGFAKPGERIVVTAGVPLRTPGATNMLRVAFVGPQKSL